MQPSLPPLPAPEAALAEPHNPYVLAAYALAALVMLALALSAHRRRARARARLEAAKGPRA